MVLIDSIKYACATCIKGHRSSSCTHATRELFEIKRKGRPQTQCEHCRELRKTKQVHVKCMCEVKKPADTGPRVSEPQERPASCSCDKDGECRCCTPRIPRVAKTTKITTADTPSSVAGCHSSPGIHEATPSPIVEGDHETSSTYYHLSGSADPPTRPSSSAHHHHAHHFAPYCIPGRHAAEHTLPAIVQKHDPPNLPRSHSSASNEAYTHISSNQSFFTHSTPDLSLDLEFTPSYDADEQVRLENRDERMDTEEFPTETETADTPTATTLSDPTSQLVGFKDTGLPRFDMYRDASYDNMVAFLSRYNGVSSPESSGPPSMSGSITSRSSSRNSRYNSPDIHPPPEGEEYDTSTPHLTVLQLSDRGRSMDGRSDVEGVKATTGSCAEHLEEPFISFSTKHGAVPFYLPPSSPPVIDGYPTTLYSPFPSSSPESSAASGLAPEEAGFPYYAQFDPFGGELLPDEMLSTGPFSTTQFIPDREGSFFSSFPGSVPAVGTDIRFGSYDPFGLVLQ